VRTRSSTQATRSSAGPVTSRSLIPAHKGGEVETAVVRMSNHRFIEEPLAGGATSSRLPSILSARCWVAEQWRMDGSIGH
jgi:hypothetical protein